MAAAARDLADRGWPIFPCHTVDALLGECSCGQAACSSPGKHPRTSRGVKDASTLVAQAEGWWRRWPGANIGLATGRGVYVVDLDGEAGKDSWRRVCADHDGEWQTLTAMTGGGGLHLYYRLPEGMRLPNTAGRIAPHVDTRGDGGYVLAPPSAHRSGRRYAWAAGEVLRVIPAWLVAMVEPRVYTPRARPQVRWRGTTPYGRGVLARALDEVARAPEGERNDTLASRAFRVGQWVGGGEIDPAGVAEALIEACPDPDRQKAGVTAVRQLREGLGYPRRKTDDVTKRGERS